MNRIVTIFRAFALVFCIAAGIAGAGMAQDLPLPDLRDRTGGAQTLEDILARQSGVTIDDAFRRAESGAGDAPPPIDSPLGTRGGASDPDLWRGLRFNSADISTQIQGPAATVLVQDGGMWWLDLRRGPVAYWGAWLLAGTLLVLAAFLLLRGRIEISGPKTGRRITRFTGIERFAHWLLAGSFLLLGLTGLFSLFGRTVLIPAFGREAFAATAEVSKWIHNNVSWAFIVALVLIFVFWVAHNLPDRTDLTWILKGGGIFTKGHPPAKKFNAGQKMIFWSVVILGASISVSGVSLLFPFEFHLFAPTFEAANSWGVPGWFDMAQLPTDLTPQEEMQYSQLWHTIIALVLTAIIFAHIYIGTVGMEGAFDAMGSGEVEEQWAREHHSLWAEKAIQDQRDGVTEPTPDGREARA